MQPGTGFFSRPFLSPLVLLGLFLVPTLVMAQLFFTGEVGNGSCNTICVAGVTGCETGLQCTPTSDGTSRCRLATNPESVTCAAPSGSTNSNSTAVPGTGTSTNGNTNMSGSNSNSSSLHPAQSETSTAPSSEQDFFLDSAGQWSHAFVEMLHIKCGVDGYKNSSGELLHLFKPKNPISRAEFIKLVVQCKDGLLPAVTTKPFPDVATTHWAAPYIAKAKQLGWTSGYSNGTFQPDRNINRVEALKIILLSHFAPSVFTVGTMDFKDTKHGVWYEKYVAFAVFKEIMSGYVDGSGMATGYFGPMNNLLRGEAAKLIYNVNGWGN